MTTQTYMRPKELAFELKKQFGIVRTADFIRAIRIESISRGEDVFIAGEARPCDVRDWIINNPRFRKNSVYRRKRELRPN